jgi:hypothetical protein
MVGGMRSVRSLNQRARSAEAGSSERRRGRRRGTTHVPLQEATEEEAQVASQDDTEEEAHVAQEEDEEAQEEHEVEHETSGSSRVYSRGK